VEVLVDTGYPFQEMRSHFTLRNLVFSMAVTFYVKCVPVKCAVLNGCAFFGGLEQSVCSAVCVISRYALDEMLQSFLLFTDFRGHYRTGISINVMRYAVGLCSLLEIEKFGKISVLGI
jgi:hypothetical protein